MKKLLHLIPYKEIYPPKNGGQLRCYHLMNELSKYFQLTVISYQSYSSIISSGYENSNNINFYEAKANTAYSFLSGKLNKILKAIYFRILKRSLKGPARSEVIDFYPILKNIQKNNSFDIVLFEHVTTLALASICKRFFSNATLILDAHNVDYKLSSKNREIILKMESTIHQNASKFLACSREDVNELEFLNKNRIRGIMLPNGVTTKLKPYFDCKEKVLNKIIFCGSLDYPPNAEGILWFVQEAWILIKEAVPTIELNIIGKENQKITEILKKDVKIKLHGLVEDVTPFYANSYVSIAPLLKGSGTRLKILEAMSFGNPVVSTTVGIEGIEAHHNIHAMIGDTPDAFATNLIELINNYNLGQLIRLNARKLVENKYDWEEIVKEKLKFFN